MFFRNSLCFITKTKNKIKDRQCLFVRNKKKVEEYFALKLYLESLNIINKY